MSSVYWVCENWAQWIYRQPQCYSIQALSYKGAIQEKTTRQEGHTAYFYSPNGTCMVSYSFLYSLTWSSVYSMCQKWRRTRNTNPIPNHLSSSKNFIFWFWGWLPGPCARWARIPPLAYSIPSATSGNGGVNFVPEDNSLQFKIIHWDFFFFFSI